LGTLFDESGNKVYVSNNMGNATVNKCKTITGDVLIIENQMVNLTTGKVLGKMPGVASYGACNQMTTADTVVVNGVTWRACYNTNLCLVELA
jgi:DNA-binding beta-propeller fold protein YncE